MAASAVGCRVRGYGLGGRWSGGGGGAGGGSLPCPCECVGVRRPEATGLGVPLEVGDMDCRRLDRHEIEGRRPPAARALAERPRGRDHDPTPEQLRALLVVVPTQHDLCPRSHDATLRLARSEEHTSELQSRLHLVCRLLLEKKKKENLKTLVIGIKDINNVK